MKDSLNGLKTKDFLFLGVCNSFDLWLPRVLPDGRSTYSVISNWFEERGDVFERPMRTKNPRTLTNVPGKIPIHFFRHMVVFVVYSVYDRYRRLFSMFLDG